MYTPIRIHSLFSRLLLFTLKKVVGGMQNVLREGSQKYWFFFISKEDHGGLLAPHPEVFFYTRLFTFL